MIAFLSDGKDGADAILADRIGEFACAKFSSRCHSKLWHKGVAMKLSLRRSMTISLVALLLVLLIVFGAGNVLVIRFVTRNIYQKYVGHWSWIPMLNNENRLDYDGSQVMVDGKPVTICQWLAGKHR